MNAETLKALKSSIAKWEKIVAGTGTDNGSSDCPLCALFNSSRNKVECEGCPVKERTGMRYCDGSPYYEWSNEATRLNLRGPVAASSPGLLRAAKKERAFLKRLLPKRGAP